MKKINLELLIPPFPLSLVLCGIIILCAKWFPQYSFSITSMAEWGLAFWALAMAFILPAVFSFIKAKTTVDPRHPNNSHTLVTSGLYKISRNPMYVGFLFLIIGTTCFYGQIVGFFLTALFVIYMNRYQIAPEEKQLIDTFGDEYIQYCQSVKRWL